MPYTAKVVESKKENTKYPYLARWIHAKKGNLFAIMRSSDEGIVIFNDSNDTELKLGSTYLCENNFEKVSSILLEMK